MKTQICFFTVFAVFIMWLCPHAMPEESPGTQTGDSGPASVSPARVTGMPCLDCWLHYVVAYAFQQQLPGSHDLDNIVGLAPGITVRLPTHVHGSARTDNQYQIDGMSITDVLTGVGEFGISPEVIDRLEIRTGGLPAEYGGDMGGIFAAHTRSGTNEWHGRVRLDYINTEWRDDWDDEIDGYYGDEFDYLQPTVTLDGPILQDRLWFLAAYSYYTYDQPVSSPGYYGAAYDTYGAWDHFDSTRTYHQPFVKLTCRPSDAHKLFVEYYSEKLCHEQAYGDPYSDTPEAYEDDERGSSLVLFDWNWRMSPAMILHMSAGRSLIEHDVLPQKQSDDPRDASFYDTYYGQQYNNGDQWQEDDRERLQILADMEWHAGDWFGDHHVKGGFEIQQHEYSICNRFPGGASYTIDPEPVGDPPDYFKGTEATRTRYMFSGEAETSADYWGAYLQDDWQITDRFRINMGLRFEQVTFENDDGDTDVPAWAWGNFRADTWLNTDGSIKHTAPMEFDGMLAPRLRLDWDLNGDGRTVISGFYGRYYNLFDLSLPEMFQPYTADIYASYEQTYTGPEWHDYDRDGIPDEDYFFDDANWSGFSETEPPFPNLIDPDLEPEYTDEFALGLRHRFTDALTVGVNYIYRKTNDMIEDVGLFLDDDGNLVWTWQGAVNDDFTGLKPGWDFDPVDKYYTRHVYWITNVPGNDREYSSIELNAEYQDDHWDARLYYTWSEAEGATTDTSAGYTGVAQFSGQYDTVGTSQNLYGELPWSAAHLIRCATSYRLDITDWYEMSIGIDAFWNSGYHYSRRGKPPRTFDPDDSSNILEQPETWTGRPPYQSYYWHYESRRGDYELPGHFNMDLSWQNTFGFGAWGDFTIIFDVTNLLDNQEIISESDIYNMNKPMLFGMADAWYPPRAYRLALKYRF